MKTRSLFIIMMIATFLLTGCGDKKQEQTNQKLAPDKTGTFWDYTLPLDERVADLVSKLSVEEKIGQMKYNSPAIERLDIPAYNWWNEALHGVARFGRATVFPQPIGMAATFDEDLIYRVSSAISDEARAKFNAAVELNNLTQYSGLTFWSPNVNIFRDPRWGRGMETWGEDPYLTGKLAGAFVRGMQGDHPKYLKTASCAKHYVVHSGPEGDRHHFNAKPPVKDFHETYLPAFKSLVIDSKVESVMCAYNRTYDKPCCGSEYLLTDILREEWGFEGHIMSDCWGINDFHRHHKATKNQAESAALAIQSGVNLNCGTAFESLHEAYKQGLVSEEEIDQRLSTLLKTRFKLGLFDPPGMVPYNNISKDIVNSPEHKAIAREAAQKSIVLLKNKDKVLPLSKNVKRLFVIGPNAANVDALLGNYHGVSPDLNTILEGISAKVNLGTRMEYRHGFLLDRENVNKIGWALSEAREADVTIVVMGLNTLLEGEEGEAIASPFKSDREDIQLPGKQVEYLKQIKENNDKPVIVVLTGGSPLAIPEVHEHADAVLFAWYPGQEGGNAVADVLFGDVSPSGKLPLTFPYSVDQLPPYDEYSMEGRTYKYMEEKPLYPFGFGLSYANFEYTAMDAGGTKHALKDSVEVKVKIKNTGQTDGEEVVQLYLSDKEASFRVPRYDLKRFQRVSLKAGEENEIRFKLAAKDFYAINDEGEEVLEPGNFVLTVGGSSPGSRSRELGAPEPITAGIMIE